MKFYFGKFGKGYTLRCLEKEKGKEKLSKKDKIAYALIVLLGILAAIISTFFLAEPVDANAAVAYLDETSSEKYCYCFEEYDYYFVLESSERQGKKLIFSDSPFVVTFGAPDSYGFQNVNVFTWDDGANVKIFHEAYQDFSAYTQTLTSGNEPLIILQYKDGQTYNTNCDISDGFFEITPNVVEKAFLECMIYAHNQGIVFSQYPYYSFMYNTYVISGTDYGMKLTLYLKTKNTYQCYGIEVCKDLSNNKIMARTVSGVHPPYGGTISGYDRNGFLYSNHSATSSMYEYKLKEVLHPSYEGYLAMLGQGATKPTPTPEPTPTPTPTPTPIPSEWQGPSLTPIPTMTPAPTVTPIPTEKSSYGLGNPYPVFDSLTIKNVFGTRDIDFGIFGENWISQKTLFLKSLIAQGMGNSYWQYNGHVSNADFINNNDLKLQLRMRLTLELPTREYIMSWIEQCSEGDDLDYREASYQCYESVMNWITEGGETESYDVYRYFDITLASDGSFSVSLTYGELFDLICYFYPEVYREFGVVEGEKELDLIATIWMAHLHVNDSTLLLMTQNNLGEVVYGRTVMNIYRKAITNQAVTVEVKIDVVNATDEEFEAAYLEALEEGFKNAYEDDSKSESYFKPDGELGDDLVDGGLWDTFESLAGGLEKASKGFVSIGNVIGNVFSFLPEEVRGWVVFGMVAVVVIAIVMALRGK